MRIRARGPFGMHALLLVLAAAGCGKGTHATPDGGDGAVITLDTGTGGGRRAFDVVAVLHGTGGSSGSLPQTNSFTLVLDIDARQAIVGGSGLGSVISVTTDDGVTFRSAGPFSVGTAMGDACNGSQSARYDSFEVTLTNGWFTGTATGSATISCGDCAFTVSFTATLTGTADATPPRLRAAGPVPGTPFAPFALAASEPLPASVTARLVADDGSGVDLVPTIVDGPLPLVVGFSKPSVVLRAGQGYVVTLDGLVDFAGLTDPGGPPLRISSFAAAAPVAADGFESATGNVLGGAMVVTTAAGTLPPIAGDTSLYLGGPGAPLLDAANGRSLALRLARAAGQTMLRYTYRVIGTPSATGFYGLMMVGSEGASPAQSYPSFVPSTGGETLTVAGQTLSASPVASGSVMLPADATDEVLVEINPTTFNCGPSPGLSAGLLIDDVHLE